MIQWLLLAYKDIQDLFFYYLDLLFDFFLKITTALSPNLYQLSESNLFWPLFMYWYKIHKQYINVFIYLLYFSCWKWASIDVSVMVCNLVKLQQNYFLLACLPCIHHVMWGHKGISQGATTTTSSLILHQNSSFILIWIFSVVSFLRKK